MLKKKDGVEKNSNGGEIENISLDLIINMDGGFLLIYLPRHDLWMLVGGHTKFGELTRKTAKRETREEVQLDPNKMIRRKKILLEHEQITEESGHKIFRVFESYYMRGDYESVVFPQKEEGIERVGWFSLEEIRQLKLSEVARLSIEEFARSERLVINNSEKIWGGLSQETREKLQIISNQIGGFFQSLEKELGREVAPLIRKLKPSIKGVDSSIKEISFSMMKIGKEMEVYFSTKKEEKRRKKPIAIVVDDETASADTLAELIRGEGFRIIPFDDPTEAYKYVKNIYEEGEKIELAIIDIVMPGMSGNILAEKIKTIDSEIEIIFISGYIEEQKKKEIKGSILLHKPFSSNELIKALKRAFKKSSKKTEEGKK